jgi:hypothetical protein|tara:strand:+ start:1288 stop:1725 length:438 start_codon:yes stop_codon:yes gene_type:complete
MRKQVTKPLISEVLTAANKLGSKGERITYLQAQDCTALRDILRINFDTTINLSLPPGEPPFKKFDVSNAKRPKELRFEYPKFANFIEVVTPKINQFKRETIFIDLLESLHPDDAVLFCNAKDKKLKLKYITKAMIKTAFPNLIKK